MLDASVPHLASTIANNEALYRKIRTRVTPLLIVLYLIAYLDRVNISFAALTMNRDLGISETVFGLGAGIFFAGYTIFAVPANLMLQRLGVRRWMATIMVTWGLLSSCMAFVHTGTVYLIVRFLLGAAEAGCFPGLILYLTYWLPPAARARMNALFVVSIPLSSVVGAPISTAILHHGAFLGLRAWQALFLVEALPAVLLGLMIPLLMPESPATVSWLSQEEKDRLQLDLQEEAQPEVSSAPWHQALHGPTGKLIIVQAVAYFAYCSGLYALGFWVPKILSSRGVVLTRLGWLTALPFLIGAIVMIISSASSDRTGDRRWHLTAGFFLAALGMTMAGLITHGFSGALLGLTLASAGVFAILPIFWTAAAQRMPPVDRPVGIAFINSVGNTAGFIGPVIIGVILQHTGSYTYGLLFTAVCLATGGIIVSMLRDVPAKPAITGTEMQDLA